MSRASATAVKPRDAATLFAALGDETRLRIVLRLCERGPESIGDLAATSAVSRQAVKKHLDVLERGGLVRGERQGREHVWQLAPERLVDARGYLDVLSKQWDDALGRLAAFVET